MDLNQIKEILKGMLTEKRYVHSINVANCAREMAKIYGEDEEKAYLAGVVHDCAKYFKNDKVEEYVKKYNIELDELETGNISLSHSVIGAYVAKYDFKIDDEDVISSVRYHTTGKVDMNLMEKIIYIADLIEVGRDYPGVEELRELVSNGKLDDAMIKSFDNTIALMLKKGNTIHPRSVAARNFMIIKRKEENSKKNDK
ncbi:bis(5'-nucleosyl)-tetraphosphatase (symmetrical) YqeK [Peptacetobacter sp.]|nr:bis(5'-nucleosyl)-tetraphosphatase (symmetrical) YqeK [Peptacetobacter sp.]